MTPSERTASCRAADPAAIQPVSTNTVKVHRTSGARSSVSSVQRNHSDTATAGKPPTITSNIRASSRFRACGAPRRVWESMRLQPEVLKAPIQRASTDPELFGGLAHVPGVLRQDLLNEHLLGLLERHVVGRDRRGRRALHAEILGGDRA